MPLALRGRVGPQNLLSSPNTRDTIDWKNEDIEHIGSLFNLFDEVGMLANKSLSVFRLCEGADTSHGDSFPAQYIRIANKVAGTIHFEMLTHFLVVNIVHDESDDFIRFDSIHHAFAHIGDVLRVGTVVLIKRKE